MKKAVIEPEIDVDAGVLDVEDDGAVTTYELGYHILPTISEDGVSKEVERVMKVLKDLGAETIGEKSPVMMDLAYDIDKKIDGVIKHFSTSYFGWVAFTLSPSKIGEVNMSAMNNPAVLRFIIVKTSPDAVAVSLAEPTVDISTKVLREAEAGGEVSEVALDSALKQIETEDTKSEEKS